MTFTRRTLIASAGAAGAVTFLPFRVRSATEGADSFAFDGGEIFVHPVEHASFVMQTPAGTIYVDPVGAADRYSDLPAPDLILITHEHGDHYNAETLGAVMTDQTRMITNPAVFDMLPEDLASRASAMANGDEMDMDGITVNAIPAYNMTEGRLQFHPEGRDNGYVLDFGGFRVYISGDTEDIPAMRELENIDLAFVCMNLPFTMDASAAASAVSDFAPTFVYPYHYRGRDGGTQDPAEFAKMVEGDVEVRMGEWYG
ncbi:MBL fold metallo-hydrolase [Marivita sp. GX14005]|uniref:MBL fold metallo-hydrolase n=1 Tax=Marivita sp. GX14005 TaxID=2942276 RepID=UPI002019789F|nr:MBL fold metallo-hydrolase [Marivita sp. GX14005]MCL3882274.1 MBL fold metallo-hydrolase [Marivita sp. GX14005]